MARLFSFLAAAAFCVVFAAAAQAMPGAAGGNAMEAARASFTKADINKDDSLSQDEFMAAFSGMKPEAFAAIDTDRDGKISRQEWQNFAISHSAGMGQQNMAMPPQQAAPAAPQGLPMVTPPAQDK